MTLPVPTSHTRAVVALDTRTRPSPHTDLEPHQYEWVLGNVLRTQAATQPDAVFLTDDTGQTLTYRETLARAEGIAAGLRARGVEAGDRVLLLMENSAEMVLTWFAASLLGAVEVPVNVANRGHSLAHAVNLCRAAVAVVDADLVQRLLEVANDLEHLETVVVHGSGVSTTRWATVDFAAVAATPPLTEIVPVTYRDLAAIIYTSGTTGPAKGVLAPHGLAYLLGRQVADRLELTRDDIYYVCLPLFHSNAQWAQVYASLIAGAQVHLRKRFSASRWLADIRTTGATVSSLLGVMTEFLDAQPEQPTDSDHRLRRVLAIPMPRRLAVTFPERFGFECIEAYGMTEISLVLWRPNGDPARPGSSGKPYGNMFDIALLDPDTDQPVPPGMVGEIAIRPRHPWTIATGYDGMPDVTAETFRNLWFHTGDAAHVDEDGYYHFVDRIRDRIRRRGENVSSFEIELAVSSHPCVIESAAVGVPADEGEDDIKIVVVTSGLVTAEDIIDHCRAHLPYFAVPRYVEFASALPKTPSGKTMKAEIRKLGVTGREWDRVAAGIHIGRDE
ncbi:AMP-binding protein [Nocardia gipuzkoensis]